MKNHVIGCVAALMVSGSALAQDVAKTITKDEFVKNQLLMMEQLKESQASMAADTDKLMQEKMTPEDYAKYKQEGQAAQKEAETKVAECLGIPVENIENMTEKVGPDFQIDVIKKCSSELPETLSLENMDWNNNASFSGYKTCAEDMVAKKIGVPTDKLQECSAMAQQMQ